jgi:glycosyltransferase involved in cell wall biosynthesis
VLEDNKHNFRPYFSICIPQYNRTDFLIKALGSFVNQTFTDFEVCIYDDNSNDKGEDKIVKFLKNSGLNYSYFKSDTNGRYDVSLRGAIDMSSGKYVLLMGNDDGLANYKTLELIYNHIKAYDDISVAITNYIELTSGREVERVHETEECGSGPKVAASIFRNYAFVSGIIFDGRKARGLSTDKVEGSEMYQMYLATSIVSNGGKVLSIKDVCIEKDLQIKNMQVDSYQNKNKIQKCSLGARILPMARIFEVIMAGLEGSHYGRKKEENLFIVAKQLYKYTYPYWIIEYRRVQSWCYSFGVYRALNPLVICSNTYNFSFYSKVKLTALYVAMGIVGFIIPISIFDKIRPALFKFAKNNNN